MISLETLQRLKDSHTIKKPNEAQIYIQMFFCELQNNNQVCDTLFIPQFSEKISPGLLTFSKSKPPIMKGLNTVKKQ